MNLKPKMVAGNRLRVGLFLGRTSRVLFLALFFLALSLAYLFGSTNLGTEAYRIYELETSLSELKQDQETLKLKESDLRSLPKIEGDLSGLNFEATDRAIRLESGEVAKRDFSQKIE